MFDHFQLVAGSSPARVMELLTAAMDAYLGLDRAALSDDELIALVRDMERQVRRLPSAQHRDVAELEARGIPAATGACSTSSFLRQLLRLSTGDSNARVAAARDFAPRTGPNGALAVPEFPLVADAQTKGEVSARHA